MILTLTAIDEVGVVIDVPGGAGIGAVVRILRVGGAIVDADADRVRPGRLTGSAVDPTASVQTIRAAAVADLGVIGIAFESTGIVDTLGHPVGRSAAVGAGKTAVLGVLIRIAVTVAQVISWIADLGAAIIDAGGITASCGFRTSGAAVTAVGAIGINEALEIPATDGAEVGAARAVLPAETV